MMRHRLTITLKEDILHEVDRVIDGAKIRNRSHAIEYLIQKASGPKVSQALILAGGSGIKTHPLGKETPKALLEIYGKPVLEHTIELCRNHEIRDLYISIGPEGSAIKKYFGDGSAFGVRINYLTQTKSNVGTAPSVRQAKDLLKDQSFLLLYGDVLADINLSDFIDFHLSSGTPATMALTSTATTSDWGVVKLHGSTITDFVEKPMPGSTHSYVINAGMYVFQPEIFSLIKPASKKLEQDLFPPLAKSGKLSGYLFDGQWFDLGAPKMYHQAAKSWTIG